MTSRQRRKRQDAALRFLIEDFIDTPDGDEGYRTESAAKGLWRFQEKAARILLPGPGRTIQRAALTGMQPAEFQGLRRQVRDWLHRLARNPTFADAITLKGPVRMWVVSKRPMLGRGEPGDLRAPLIEGSPSDVFWFYLVNLVCRAGVAQIRVCQAPRSRREPSQQAREPGMAEPCERLFVRRGNAKQFCSNRCRARVATQRARGMTRKTPRSLPTQRVRLKKTGQEYIINVADFDPKRHEDLRGAPMPRRARRAGRRVSR